MENRTRITQLELLAGSGEIEKLKQVLGTKFSQEEIDIALANAIAYSQIETAKFLISLGADIAYRNYEGVYYAVHNDELEGLKFSISLGVDINVNNGMLLNTSIETTINSKNQDIIQYLLDNGADRKLLSSQSWESVQNYGSTSLKKMVFEK
ncbi:hypothetical protein BKI52_02850 [marine bacterium AO1-C]|nr:hypothetical protein BKI52_02850 [marine bacterium AO1-C]